MTDYSKSWQEVFPEWVNNSGAMKRITPPNIKLEIFVYRGRCTFGNKYDYSFVEYVNNSTKVKIICPVHNEKAFEKSPSKHWDGQGCPVCAAINKANAQAGDRDSFIKSAIKVHGEKYDYSLVQYVRSNKKVTIICRSCGLQFDQTPNNHLSGQGCHECAELARKQAASKRKKTTEKFIEDARAVHGNKYDYSITNYTGAHEDIQYLCQKHGVITQKATNHLFWGCQYCAYEANGKNCRMNRGEFVARSIVKHGEAFYDYSNLKTDKVRSIDKVTIGCPVHGEFNPNVNAHLFVSGCPSCAIRGFNPKAAAHLYILLSECGLKMKVGITNVGNEAKRARSLRKETPFKWNVLEAFRFEVGKDAYDLEQAAHSRGVNSGLSGFDGATEWFEFDGSLIEWIRQKARTVLTEPEH